MNLIARSGMSTVIQGANVFLEDRFSHCDLLIKNGKIEKIGRGIKADQTFQASGLLAIPGLIDPHVHLREPGLEYKEDFRTGTLAAIAGGFTTVLDMPNTKPPTTTVSRLQEKTKLCNEKAVCDVFFHFGGTDDNLEEIRKANPRSIKIYLGLTTGELKLAKPDSLDRHFENAPEGCVLFFHASGNGTEKNAITETITNIGSVGNLSKKNKRIFYIAHASCGAEIEKIKTFEQGFVEVSPHHMFLSAKDAARLGNMGTVYPELRSEALRKTLWQQLGRVDCIGTDHAPHTIDDKENGAHGFPGLETALGLMLDAYHNRLLELEWIIPRMTSAPADMFGLERVGRIREGHNADITLIDPKTEWTVRDDMLQTKCKWSPFEGKKLKGRAVSVFRKGELVVKDNEILISS